MPYKNVLVYFAIKYMMMHIIVKCVYTYAMICMCKCVSTRAVIVHVRVANAYMNAYMLIYARTKAYHTLT